MVSLSIPPFLRRRSRLLAELAEARRRIAELEEKLEIDPLLNVFNRRVLERALRSARADKSPAGAQAPAGPDQPPYEVEVAAVELHDHARVIQFGMYKVVSNSRPLFDLDHTNGEAAIATEARRCAAGFALVAQKAVFESECRLCLGEFARGTFVIRDAR